MAPNDVELDDEVVAPLTPLGDEIDVVGVMPDEVPPVVALVALLCSRICGDHVACDPVAVRVELFALEVEIGSALELAADVELELETELEMGVVLLD